MHHTGKQTIILPIHEQEIYILITSNTRLFVQKQNFVSYEKPLRNKNFCFIPLKAKTFIRYDFVMTKFINGQTGLR